MPGTNVYTDLNAPESNKKSLGEVAQIALLSVIIVIFFAIAASNVIGLFVSVLHR